MNSIVLIIQKDSKWSPFLWVEKKGGGQNEFGQYVYEDEKGWLSFFDDIHMSNDFDEKEIENINGQIKNPKFYSVEWSCDEVLQKFINEIPCDTLTLIDNDHGLIFKARDLINKPVSSWIHKGI